VRQTLGKWADALGVRKALKSGRDRLVDVLNGDGYSPVIRRNRQDDHHLVLLLRFGLRANSNYLDVGANRGAFLRDIQRLAPDGHHIAYEPLPELCEELTRQFPGIDIRQKALSNVEGKSEFVHVLDPGFQAYSGLADHLTRSLFPQEVRTENIIVSTERLDDHLPEGWLPDFVKIDVEGAEYLVLQGALETLRTAKPVIVFEHGMHGEGSRDLHRLLCADIGLRLFNMDGEGPLDSSQFIDQLATRWNWVAHR
jgi:FkbM family methyltransferase